MAIMSLRWLGALALLLTAAAACSSDSSSGGNTAAASSAASTSTSTSTLVSVPPETTSTSTTSTTTTSSTTSTSTTSTTTTTLPATTAVPDPATTLVLSGTGLGDYAFGSAPDEVIAAVTELYGEPTRDTDWVDPLSIAACPGTELRIVSWDALDLAFGDESSVATGERHFSSYSYGIDGQIASTPPGLLTTNGIGLGSSIAELRNAYPDVTLTEESDFGAANFFVNDALRGYITGVDDSAAVTVIVGGDGCGF